MIAKASFRPASLPRPLKPFARAIWRFWMIWRHPLNRQHPIRAELRWMRLMIALRASPSRQVLIPYAGSAMLHCRPDAGSVMICAWFGLGEYHDMAFCLHVLRPGDLFCDIGANAGVYTILAAKVVGARVVAVEPIMRTFNLFMQNVYANAVAARVDAWCAGAGREAGTLRFTASLGSFNHVAAAGEPNTEQVDVQPLDDILAGRTPTLLKIDVEGFEAAVLAGAPGALANPGLQAVLIEVADVHLRRYGASDNDIYGALSSAGFRGPYWYDPEQRKLAPAGAPKERRYNQIFVRDSAWIEARAAAAAQFQINDAVI